MTRDEKIAAADQARVKARRAWSRADQAMGEAAQARAEAYRVWDEADRARDEALANAVDD